MPPRWTVPLLLGVAFMLAEGAPAGGTSNVSFTGDWETGNVSQWTWGAQCSNYGVASGGNLYLVTDPVSQGTFGGRFDLPASSSSNACEVLRKRSLNLGADEYYGMDVRFPTDWQEPSSAGWGMVIGQFNFQGVWGPPVGLFAHRDHVKLVTQSGYCRSVSTANPGCTYSSGIGGNVPMTFAIPSSRFATNVWHQLVVHVRWSTTSTGVLEVWHRPRGERSWVKTVSQTGYPTVQWTDNKPATSDWVTSDKIGAYRGAASFATSVWHDAFAVGTSFDSVAQALDHEASTEAPAPAPPSTQPAPSPTQTVTPAPAPAPAPPPAPSPAPVPSVGSPATPAAPAASPTPAPSTTAPAAEESATARGKASTKPRRAAARVQVRFRRGFVGRAVGLRVASSADRAKAVVIIYHRSRWGWRIFRVERLHRNGSFQIEKRPWSRRRLLFFRAVVAVPGRARVSSRTIALRRSGKAPSAFEQARNL